MDPGHGCSIAPDTCVQFVSEEPVTELGGYRERIDTAGRPAAPSCSETDTSIDEVLDKMPERA
jgi:hypothetical protein